MWTIQGGPCNGYRLHTPTGAVSDWHFAKLWDAIDARDKINRGEIRPKS